MLFQYESPIGGDCSVSQETLIGQFFPGNFKLCGEFRFVGLGCDDNGSSVRREISRRIHFRIVQTVQEGRTEDRTVKQMRKTAAEAVRLSKVSQGRCLMLPGQ